MNSDRLIEEQREIGIQANVHNPLKQDTRYIAGFDVIYNGNQAVCAAAVFDLSTLKIVEKKHIIGKAPIPYIAGLRSFRDGPLIIQAYYDLEQEPDILFLSGHGIAHPQRCGVATYVGVELNKPALGVAKSIPFGEVKNESVTHHTEEIARILKTREYANNIIISAGHLLTLTDAVDLVKKTILLPHKLPEPLHYAHKHARSILRHLLEGTLVEEKLPEEDFEEYRANTGTIV